MVYTEPAPKRQQFHVTPVMQQPNSAVTRPLRQILNKTRYEKEKYCSYSFRTTCDLTAVSRLDNREQRYIKAINKKAKKEGRGCMVLDVHMPVPISSGNAVVVAVVGESCFPKDINHN